MSAESKLSELAVKNLAELPLEKSMELVCNAFFPNIAIASSFSVEDSVLIDAACRVEPKIVVFAIDTGRLPEETYSVAEEWRRRGINIQWHFPRREEVERLEREKGLFSFRQSIEDRHECCQIRKVEPLRRALTGLQAWMTGLRREQSTTRAELEIIEYDSPREEIVKLNLLANWTEAEIWARARSQKLPYSALHEKGYSSIGCAPCSRAVEPGQHLRSGRWWWESPEHRECGLHICPIAK